MDLDRALCRGDVHHFGLAPHSANSLSRVSAHGVPERSKQKADGRRPTGRKQTDALGKRQKSREQSDCFLLLPSAYCLLSRQQFRKLKFSRVSAFSLNPNGKPVGVAGAGGRNFGSSAFAI